MPTIGAGRSDAHVNGGHFAATGISDHDVGADRVVSFAKDGRRDRDRLTHNRARGKFTGGNSADHRYHIGYPESSDHRRNATQ